LANRWSLRFQNFIGALLAGGRRGHVMSAWNGLFEAGEDQQVHLDALGRRFVYAFLFRKIYDVTNPGSKYETKRAALRGSDQCGR
jgi:hypothetical protein